MKKNCLNCRYRRVGIGFQPCKNCHGDDHWRPQESDPVHGCDDCRHGNPVELEPYCNDCNLTSKWEPKEGKTDA